jgi:hypothetical protein
LRPVAALSSSQGSRALLMGQHQRSRCQLPEVPQPSEYERLTRGRSAPHIATRHTVGRTRARQWLVPAALRWEPRLTVERAVKTTPSLCRFAGIGWTSEMTPTKSIRNW